MYVATQEKLYFKLKQIHKNEYNWLKEEHLEKCMQRLERTIGKQFIDISPLVEETIVFAGDNDAHSLIDVVLKEHFGDKKFRFTARTDIITENTLWELKCTSKLTADHQLQLVIYAWLWMLCVPLDDVDGRMKEFKLYNVKTDELLVLDATFYDINEIMVLLLNGKYFQNKPKNDEEFVEETQT